MAEVTTYLTPKTKQPIVDVSAYIVTWRATLPASGISNADNIQAIPILRNGRLLLAALRQKATLGAGATLKLQLNRDGVRTDLTVATTAAGASLVTGITLLPVDVQADDIIEVLVGGANISASADVEVDLLLQH